MDGKRANAIFRAFSDETRLRILHLLKIEEMCVGDLVSILELPQPTVSRHLSYLRNAELVETRKEGLWRFYRLSPVDNQLQERLFGCLGRCFKDIPTLDEDERRAAELKASGTSCCPEVAQNRSAESLGGSSDAASGCC